MNAEIEAVWARAVDGAGIVGDGWQVEPGTSGDVLDPARHWLLIIVDENTRIAGPLWRGLTEFRFLSPALADGETPAGHRAAVEAIQAWLDDPAAVLTAFNSAALAAGVVLNGIFVAGGPRPEQQENRWVSGVRVTCGWTRGSV
jgi:hypothetical protein